MRNLLILLSPRYKKLRHRIEKPGVERKRLAAIGFLVVGLWAVLFVVCFKALTYFTAEEMFGIIAATKLLSMMLVTLTFVAVISNLITSFSTFFLFEDLELIVASPVPGCAIYTVRFIETLVESSWMVSAVWVPHFSRIRPGFLRGLDFLCAESGRLLLPDDDDHCRGRVSG